jgi:hypothetical protein
VLIQHQVRQEIILCLGTPHLQSHPLVVGMGEEIRLTVQMEVLEEVGVDQVAYNRGEQATLQIRLLAKATMAETIVQLKYSPLVEAAVPVLWDKHQPQILVEMVEMVRHLQFRDLLLLMQEEEVVELVAQPLPRRVWEVLVELEGVGMGVRVQLAYKAQQIQVVAVAVAVKHRVQPLQDKTAAQAAQASSFSNGPSPYRPQIPLHLPVHG